MRGRWAFLAGLLVAVSTTTGCMEEKVDLQLEADGRGKVKVERLMGQQMSSMLLMMAPDKDAAVGEQAAEALAEWEGVSAWTDVETINQGGRVGFKATGWFEDAAKVKKKSENNQTGFTIERAGGNMTVKLAQGQNEGGAEGDQSDEMFTADDQTFEMQRGMAKGMLAGMLNELKIEMAVTLPGEVTEATGLKKDGRRAAFVVEGKTMSGAIDKMFDRVAELRPKVKAGEMTVTEAKAQVQNELGDIMGGGSKDMSATCAEPAADPAAKAAFDKALGEAKAAYEASPWKEKVETAKLGKGGEFGEDDGMGGGEGD